MNRRPFLKSLVSLLALPFAGLFPKPAPATGGIVSKKTLEKLTPESDGCGGYYVSKKYADEIWRTHLTDREMDADNVIVNFWDGQSDRKVVIRSVFTDPCIVRGKIVEVSLVSGDATYNRRSLKPTTPLD